MEGMPNEIAKELAIMRNGMARKADEEVCWQRYQQLLRQARRNRRLCYAIIIAVVTGTAGVNCELGQMILHRLGEMIRK